MGGGRSGGQTEGGRPGWTMGWTDGGDGLPCTGLWLHLLVFPNTESVFELGYSSLKLNIRL